MNHSNQHDQPENYIEDLPTAYATFGNQKSISTTPTTATHESASSSSRSMTWPLGYTANMARRHSIHLEQTHSKESQQQPPQPQPPQQPQQHQQLRQYQHQQIPHIPVPRMPELFDGALQSGSFVIDGPHYIGSTSLTNAWDTSVNPNALLCCQSVSPQHYQEYLQREGRVWMTLRRHPHPNLPMLVACQDPGKGQNTEDGFVFFNPVYGDLYADTRSIRPHSEILKLFRQMVRAVTHCHKHRIVLGNVKLGKFLWANQERTSIQLADLGGSQLIKEGGQCKVSNAAGSPAYIAPEVLSEVEHYDGFAADIWSLGVVCYVILMGRYPFEDTTSAGLFKKIKTAEIEYPKHLPPAIVNFLKKILVRDPTERPTAKDIAIDEVIASLASTRPQPQSRQQQCGDASQQILDGTDEDYSNSSSSSTSCSTSSSVSSSDNETDAEVEAATTVASVWNQMVLTNNNNNHFNSTHRPLSSTRQHVRRRHSGSPRGIKLHASASASASALPTMAKVNETNFYNHHNNIDTLCEAVVPVVGLGRRRSLQIIQRCASQEYNQQPPDGSAFRSGKRGSWCAGLDQLLHDGASTDGTEREIKRSNSNGGLHQMAQQLQQTQQLQIEQLQRLQSLANQHRLLQQQRQEQENSQK